MKPFRSRFALALVAALTLTQISPGPGAAAVHPLSKSSLRIVTSNTGFFFALLYVAAARGYFKQEGLDVTILDGGGGPNALAAVVGGGADLCATGLGNIAHVIEHGQHFVIVGSIINNNPFVVVVRTQLAKEAGITPSSTFAQRAAVLQHRTVAVEALAGGSGAFVKYAMAEAHLDPNTVTLINMAQNPAQLASLKGGKIDAFANTSPVTDSAIAEGVRFRPHSRI